MPGACGAAIEQRDTASDVHSVLIGATAQVTPIKAKLIAAYAKTDFNSEASIKANVLPPLQELNSVLASTAGKINALKGKKSSTKRQIDTSAVAAARKLQSPPTTLSELRSPTLCDCQSLS